VIRYEVERIASEFSKLFASRDVDALVDMYDDEAKLLAPGAPLIEGRPGVRVLLEALFAQGARALEFETGDVFESGALVIEIGSATLVIQPEGADAVRDVSKYVVVYPRQPDGALKLLVDAFNSDTPS
jgi:ketosteroid isomerase-like protein